MAAYEQQPIMAPRSAEDVGAKKLLKIESSGCGGLEKRGLLEEEGPRVDRWVKRSTSVDCSIAFGLGELVHLLSARCIYVCLR